MNVEVGGVMMIGREYTCSRGGTKHETTKIIDNHRFFKIVEFMPLTFRDVATQLIVRPDQS